MTDQMLIAEAHEEIAELKQQLEGWQDQLDEQDTVNLNLLKANKQLRQQLDETNAYIEEALHIKRYLPRISREMYDALGETGLMTYDIEDNKPIWTQDAVDFIAYLPKQSLGKLKADAVREFASEMTKLELDNSDGDFLRNDNELFYHQCSDIAKDYADKIEKEGE